MLNTRLVALSVLAFTLLPACDSKSGDDAGTETAEGTDGASSGASSGDESTTGSADVSHEGEVCDTPGATAPCTLEGVPGLEYCHPGELGSASWSVCVPDACAIAEESRACEGGTQYCTPKWIESGMILQWGVCSDAGTCELGDSRDCGIEDLPISQQCILDSDGVPNWNEEDCNTPLVLSFGAAVAFAPAPALAADFDIHGGAGVCTRADWPSAATPWLALDRDRNGSIDGGHELFGSGTRLSTGTGSPNGFAALAELDSDGDGKLSPADARWAELVLWGDSDGDRRSSGWETLPLASFEVVEIDLSHDSRRECDSAGNCGVERARFVYRTLGQTRMGEVIDVHLACD